MHLIQEYWLLALIIGGSIYLFCRTAIHYEFKCHKQAGVKFGCLLLASSSPIVFSYFLMENNSGNDYKFIESSELFIYTAAFISPYLYILVERYYESLVHSPKMKTSTVRLRCLPPGFLLLSGAGAIVLILSCLLFVASHTNPQDHSNTRLANLLNNYILYLYIFSLACWYLSLADGFSNKDPKDFIENGRKEERTLFESFQSSIQRNDR